MRSSNSRMEHVDISPRYPYRMCEGDLENYRLLLVEGDGSLVAAVWPGAISHSMLSISLFSRPSRSESPVVLMFFTA